MDAEFRRELKIFPSNYHAVRYYRGVITEDTSIDAAYRDYDAEDEVIRKVI